MFELLIADKHDGYDARLWLGKIAVDEGNLAEAKTQLALAKGFDPDSAEPYALLAKALSEDGSRRRDARSSRRRRSSR